MKRPLFAVAMLLAGSAFAQQRVPEISVHFGPRLPQSSGGHEFRRGAGRGRELQGPRLRLLALEQRERPRVWRRGGAAVRIRSERQVRARDRQGPLCLVGGAQRAHRSERQHLGHRQGLEHDRQVQPAGPRRVGVRPQAGSGRRRRAAGASRSAAAAGGRQVPSADRRRVGLAGQHLHHRRLHQFARRQVRQERRLGEVMGHEGHRPWPVRHPALDRHRPRDNIYVGDRTNHRIQVFDTDGNFKRMFSIDVPPDPTSRPVNGATPTGERLKQAIGAPNSICITPGPARCCSSANRPTRDASSRSRSTARCSA